MKLRGKSMAYMVGAVAGTALSMAITAVVVGMGTGHKGMLALIIIMVLAGASGWVVGYYSRISRRNREAYSKGYRDGMAKKTLVIQRGDCFHMIQMPDEAAK